MVALSGLLFIPVISLAVLWQKSLGPLIRSGGVFRHAEPLNNENCRTIPELEGCEKMVLDHKTNLLYLACSRVAARPYWLPSVGHLSASRMATDDYVAIYNIATSKVTHLAVAPYPNAHRGLSLHGMDVVRSASDSNHLYVYLVNHRPPLLGIAEEIGADSTVEIFSLEDGTFLLKHVATVEDPVILTPNDVVGSSDGNSFWFTNDHGIKTGLLRHAELYLSFANTSVGYCHLRSGCKFAATKLSGANGIVRSATNDTFYVGSAHFGGIGTFELQGDNTLVKTDVITTDDHPVDNLSIDSNGALWATGFPRGIAFLHRAKDLVTMVPTRAIRVTENAGPNMVEGQRYKSEKFFEDDGRVTSGSTSIVFHPPTRQLFIHGILSPALAICQV